MRPWAILVTDQRLVPPWGGNRVRIWGLIAALRNLGWRVALATIRSNPPDQLRGRVDQVFYAPARPFAGGDLRAFDAEPYRHIVTEVSRALRPALAIAEYAWLTPALRDLPRGVLRWVDCHDILSERTLRFRAAGLAPWIVCSPELERELLDGADLLLAIQELDADWLRAQLPHKAVARLLPCIDLPSGFRRTSPRNFEVLTIGAEHAGNIGIRAFARDHWSRVMARLPKARLRVVGAIGDGLDARPGVDVLGRVADLTECYASAAVVICPIEVGTGVKIKMIEALRHGKAVVASSAASEGIPPSGDPAWIDRESLADCADALIDLLSDHNKRVRLENAAFAHAEREFSPAQFESRLRALLPGWSRRLATALGI